MTWQTWVSHVGEKIKQRTAASQDASVEGSTTTTRGQVALSLSLHRGEEKAISKNRSDRDSTHKSPLYDNLPVKVYRLFVSKPVLGNECPQTIHHATPAMPALSGCNSSRKTFRESLLIVPCSKPDSALASSSRLAKKMSWTFVPLYQKKFSYYSRNTDSNCLRSSSISL